MRFSFYVRSTYFLIIEHRLTLPSILLFGYPIIIFHDSILFTDFFFSSIPLFICFNYYLFVSKNKIRKYILMYFIDLNLHLDSLFGQLFMLFDSIFLFLQLISKQLHTISHQLHVFIHFF